VGARRSLRPRPWHCADALAHIFDKFYRVPGTAAGGTGLGLSICRGLVEAHGGTLTAHNAPRGRHDFFRPSAKNGATTARTGGWTMSEGPHVLVVDDEVQIRRFLRISLEANNYRVYEAEHGAAALAQAALHRPDVIILDMNLPDMEGVEVLRRLREWASTPVIMLSVRAADRTRSVRWTPAPTTISPSRSAQSSCWRGCAWRCATASRLPREPVLTIGDVQIDLARRLVTRKGEAVKLTPTEYALLRLLVQHAGKVLTHRQILKEVWGPQYVDETHYLRVYFGQLRQKLEENPAVPKLIVTEPGIGYRLVAE
jgi:two-component system KDP operon response regulator KdpE